MRLGRLPRIWAGIDDFRMAKDNRLVVSERAVRLLKSGQLDDCRIEEDPRNADEGEP